MENRVLDESCHVKSNKLKSINASTHVISFFGEDIEDVTLFVAKVCSTESLVLIVDLSEKKKLFLNVVGDIRVKAVMFRKVCYTCDDDYFKQNKGDYDTVLIYSDTLIEEPQIIDMVDFVYLGCGLHKYSMITLRNMIEVINKKVSYSLICRGAEKEAEKYFLNDNLQLFCIKKRKPEDVYFIPKDTKDNDSLLRFEYGVLDVAHLSTHMYDAVNSVCDKLRSLTGKSITYLNSESKAVNHWMM